MQPKLKFFCELATPDLQSLLQDGKGIRTLQELQAGLCLGITDLSAARAQIARQLNVAGIKVTAWILLPEEQGLWSNLDNAHQTAERYRAFKAWTMENDLQFEAVGLDFKPAISDLRALSDQKYRMLGSMLFRAFRPGRFSGAVRAYFGLASQIRADGYPLETYQLPWIVDERIAHSRILQRFLGFVDLPADIEVLMIFSSFIRPWGPGMLWSYGVETAAIAVGSTGGGIIIPNFSGPPLTWDEFELALRSAWRWGDYLYIHSFEGCLEQNFLKKIATIEWDKPILEPYPLTERVNHRRISFQALLWGFTHFSYFLLIGLLLVILIRLRQRK